jgi:hypothetical protein
MTTLLTDRLTQDAEQLLLAVEALFPEDSERVRCWVARRISNGDFSGRTIDARLLMVASARWPDPLFRRAFDGAVRFMDRQSSGLFRRLRAAV